MKKKTINLNQSYKKEHKFTKRKQREREYSQFCVGKIWIKQENDIKFIQNKMGRRRVKILFKKKKERKEV